MPQAGDSRAHAEAAALPVFVKAFVIPNRKRAGTHQAHIAFEDIEELRQFVDAGAPQKFADGRDTRVIFDLENGPRNFVVFLKLGHHLLGIGHHGSELQDEEPALI